MDVTLRVWRQGGSYGSGGFKEYPAKGISPEASFLEMLDGVNEQLIEKGDEPIEFDSDCREGICGMCGLMVNGIAHGPEAAITGRGRALNHHSTRNSARPSPAAS